MTGMAPEFTTPHGQRDVGTTVGELKLGLRFAGCSDVAPSSVVLVIVPSSLLT